MMQPVDLAVLGAYLLATLLLGLWIGARRRSSDAFMSAGRRIPGWAVALSIFGTYVSSITFLAVPGKAYAGNWNLLAFSLSIPAAAWIAVRWFVPFYRSLGQLSAYEHLEQRFGPWARTFCVACYLLTQLARMGSIMYLLALALAPLTGWSVPALILLCGALVIVYSAWGGMESVIWTDVVQSIVLVGGALISVAILLGTAPQGPAELWRYAAEHDKFSLGSFGGSLAEKTFWVTLAYGFCINLNNFGIDQSYVQRYQTAATPVSAARSVWLGALLYLPVSMMFLLIGTLLFATYAARPDAAALQPDQVFPHFIAHQLPIGLRGLVIAAVFAAAQSTLSSSMNCAATLILCDLYRRYWRAEPSEAEALRVLRGATLLVGLAGTGIALAMIGIHSTLDTWWKLAGVFSGGMLGLFLLGRLAPRVGGRAAAGALAAGVAVILWMTFSPSWAVRWPALASPLDEWLIPVGGTLTVLVVGMLGARRRR